MKITVIVKTRARSESVTKKDDEHYDVSVRAMPHEGAANDAVIRALATYFHVAPSCVTLIKGSRSKQKIFEITMVTCSLS